MEIKMKLIVGLGNHGEKYAKCRHNTGFILIDKIVGSLGLEFKENKRFKCFIAEDKKNDTIFIKPLTYMNNSGDSVSVVSNFFKISAENIMVIHDDVDLEFCKVKVQKSANSAGHHGVESIIVKLGTKDFYRVRVGIGKPENKAIAVEDWVLMDFTDEEYVKVNNLKLNEGNTLSNFLRCSPFDYSTGSIL